MDQVVQLQTAFDRHLELKSELTQCIATYVFFDKHGHLCGKSKTLHKEPKSVEDLPLWSFGTDHDLRNSDVTLIPVAMFRDPFMRGHHKLVICDGQYMGESFGPNKRSACKRVMDLCAEHEIQIGMEQEYTMFALDDSPFGWPKNGLPKFPFETLHYFYGVGPDRVYGRSLSEAHYLCCLYAGVNIYGTNSEATPAQWEYQVGPCDGVSIGDHMIASRYILLRCSEDFGIKVTFDPRPIEGRWTGTGCHTNFSTKATRSEGGLEVIKAALEKMSKRVPEHLAVYDPHGGADNARRLAGGYICPEMKKFTWGVADRTASVRIPRAVADAGKGYFEDRRPASNCDPYEVARIIAETCCLGVKE